MQIDELLKSRGIKKTELAARLGIYKQNVNSLLVNPTESTMRKLAEAIGCEIGDFFPVEKEEPLLCPHCGKPIKIKIE